MKIDFISDVACPWCVVGLLSLEEALRRTGIAADAALHFQPFELNPAMPPEGEDAQQHLQRKYGAAPEQLAQTRAVLHERGAALGFTFGTRARVWNTFDAHRLLHWAGLEDAGLVDAGLEDAAPEGAALKDASSPPADHQRRLKHALLAAYHADGSNPGEPGVLRACAAAAGLDAARAAAVIDSDAFAAEVRAAEQHFQHLGIHSVPAVVINDRHLISGGQPPEVFEQALRQIAAETATETAA